MKFIFICLSLFALCFPAFGQPRPDGAIRLNIPLSGSLQNPAFSPDGRALRVLVSDGSTNVSLPGASWNARTRTIVFSSTRGDHDEIFMIKANGRPGQEVQLTNRANLYIININGSATRRLTNSSHYDGAPSVSPDNRTVAFESTSGDPDRSLGSQIWITGMP